MAMNERFTQRAQQAIILSQQYAAQLRHNYVGTEHLLLGLLQEGEGIAAKALSNLGVEIHELQQRIIDVVGQGLQQPQLVGYTPRSKRVFELSFQEARNLGHNYIGTEHLLLGLIREGEGVAARVLVEMGVSLEKARAEVLQLLNTKGPQNNNQGGETKNKTNTPTLDKYGRDLNEMAREGKIILLLVEIRKYKGLYKY